MPGREPGRLEGGSAAIFGTGKPRDAIVKGRFRLGSRSLKILIFILVVTGKLQGRSKFPSFDRVFFGGETDSFKHNSTDYPLDQPPSISRIEYPLTKSAHVPASRRISWDC